MYLCMETINHTQQQIDKDKMISNTFFTTEVLPILTKALNLKDFLSIENNSNPILLQIDRQCGIDGLLQYKDGGCKACSLRIANPSKSGQAYKNYTIRYAKHNGAVTEWDKMQLNYKNDYTRPQLSIQINKDSSGEWTAAIIKTDDLISYIIDYECYDLIESDNATMLIVNYRSIEYYYSKLHNRTGVIKYIKSIDYK